MPARLTRSIPPSMDPEAVAAIDARLEAIRASGVKIPLAVESGSRAWGFPSPDSDYDCRFVFIRPVDDYLTPWPRRDVIETPLQGELDVNGWELGKALKLLLKGNAVIIEWLTSPIAYGADEAFRSGFLDLSREVADRRLIGRHYLHLGVRQRNAYFADHKQVALKKIFYAVRPAAALRWLRLHPEAAIAPMRFQTLMSECDAPPALSEIIDELVARKAVTRELGAAPLPHAVAEFVDREFEISEGAFFGRQSQDVTRRNQATAEDFFREALRSAWGG